MPAKEFIEKIWSDTEGNDFDKAHAVLKEYFHKRTASTPLIMSRKDVLIQLFLERKTIDGKPIDTISKLISAASYISSRPTFLQFIDVIIAHAKVESDDLDDSKTKAKVIKI